jgi:drug/metabolite transporter (DMT)-like permease
MRIGVKEFPPFLFAGLRQFIAGVLLLSYLSWVKKSKFPSWANLGRQAFGGLLMITLGNGLVSWAEVYVPSGVAAIICSLMPVWVVLINLTINRSELPNGLIIVGVFTGLGGIILVFNEYLADFVNANYRWGIAFIFIASLTWALGSVIIKRSSDGSNPIFNAGLQMFFGGLWCFVLSFLFDDLTHLQWTASVGFSLGYLIVVGSVAAFAMYVYALTQLPITIASLYSYVNPLVAVLLGWVALDEKLNLIIGAAIVVTAVGIYLVNRGYQLKNQKVMDLSKMKS